MRVMPGPRMRSCHEQVGPSRMMAKQGLLYHKTQGFRLRSGLWWLLLYLPLAHVWQVRTVYRAHQISVERLLEQSTAPLAL